MVGYHKPNYPDPDDPKISVMLEAFAGSITSPLYHELVRKRRVASSVGQEEGPGSAYPGLASFSLVPRENTSNHELLESFDEVLGQFKAKPIDPERMLVAKRALVVDFVTAHQSNANIALAFATYELLYGGWDVGFKWLNEALQVTAEDAGSMLDKYFLPSNRTVARLEAAGG
ncbi:MAG: hypothetical protein DCC75_06340 [Proteobacteria bacterium]|nr:MAG: hypothetical protein DCC75_06340 [Pseudomonadota bacterium]